MDRTYADTVRLLLAVAPEVFANDIFAMKGGTAINWSLLQCGHAAELPALRWKLSNLQTFRKRRPQDFAAQAEALRSRLFSSG